MADVPMQEAAAAAPAQGQGEAGAARGKERKERPRKEEGAKGKAKDDKAREKEKAAQKRKREGEAGANGEKSEKAEPEFACRLKYRNTLPDLPFDPKLRTIPLDAMRHVRYRITSIENLYRFPVLTEPDLGIPIDLLDPDTYRLPPNKPPLAAEDVALLVKPSSDKLETPRVSVQWLRKHQYITHDYSLEKLYTRGRQDAGRGIVRAADPLTQPREAQMEAIERGFEAAKRPPVHATNPKLTPVEVLNVLPALELWGSSFNHVIFDTSPIPNPPHPSDADYANKVAAGEALVRRSVLKGYSERSTAEKFTVLYVPKPADATDAKAASLFGDDNDEAGPAREELEWVRKYNYKIDSSVKDCFILAPHPEKGCITFLPLDTKVTLTKSSVPATEKPTRATLVRQEINDEEKAVRQTRIAGLLEG